MPTPSDMAAWGRIAAWHIYQGATPSEVEAALAALPGQLSQQQIEDVIEHGQAMLDLAADFQARRWARAQLGMADVALPGLQGWRVYAKYQAGDTDPQWYSVNVRVQAGASTQDIVQAVGRAILDQTQGFGLAGGKSPISGSVRWVWVSPGL